MSGRLVNDLERSAAREHKELAYPLVAVMASLGSWDV